MKNTEAQKTITEIFFSESNGHSSKVVKRGQVCIF